MARSHNYLTRSGNAIEMNELPLSWRRRIKDLRAENARYRWEAKELRDELDALRESMGV